MNRLKLKEGISAKELLKFGFRDQRNGEFDYCMVGYLNWLRYDCKTRFLYQNVSTSDFCSYETRKQGRPILKIISNQDTWYKENKIIFDEKLKDLFELISVSEE